MSDPFSTLKLSCLLIRGVSYPFSVFCLDKSNLPPEKSMFCFFFFLIDMLPPVSYSTICANMSANNLVLCFVFILFLERGKKKKTTPKLKPKTTTTKNRFTTLKASEELAQLLQKVIAAGLVIVH